MKKFIFTLLCLALAGSTYAATIIVDVNGGGHFETIQAAIDAAVNGDVVVLQPGTFTGYGNRDIDFLGKAITVHGATGDPNDVIIDCQGTASEPHRGFNFVSAEDANSILEAVTITNGCGPQIDIGGFFNSVGGAIYCESSSPVLKNCIFSNNLADNSAVPKGGAIYFSQSNTNIYNCTIIRNTAEAGAGIYNQDSDLTIDNCRIIKNSSSYGGGLYNKGSNIKISNSTIKYNSATAVYVGGYGGYGGGIHCSSGNVTVMNCTINSNRAELSGGGIYNTTKLDISDSNVTNNSSKEGGGVYNTGGSNIIDCNFTNNHASKGGGIYNGSITTVINNCTIKDNLAYDYGGGIYNYNGTPRITNCLIIGNSATSYGGGIYNQNKFTGTTSVSNCTIVNNSADWGGGICNILFNNTTITNSIIWSNSQPQISTAELLISYSNIQGGYNGVENIDINPEFTDQYHLSGFSPCIDAGDPNYIAEPNETDLDGRPRVLFGRIDMGAYEFNNIPIADAGPNQTAYAWIDGFAEVILDGNDSWDPDGNELTYLWSWTIDGNLYDTNGINPIIELPIGTNNIELIVNDGIDDSEPNYTTVTVIAPFEVPMHFTPRMLNPKSKGKWVKAHFILPAGFTVDDVNTNSPARIIEPFTAESVYMDVFLNEDDLVKIMAAFDRAVFCSNGSMLEDIVVIARLTTGQYFYGTDTIRIKTNNLEYLAVLTSYWLEAGCGEPDWCAGADLNRDSVVDFIDFAFFDGCCLEFIKN